jgi:hypothetical protein
MITRQTKLTVKVFLSVLAATLAAIVPAQPSFASASLLQTPQSSRPVAKRIGAIKVIDGTEITLIPDSGADIKISVQPSAQIVRIAPGETNVNNVTPIHLQDLQVGDLIRATGWASDENPFPVLKIVVMKHSDLEARHQQDLQDWQRRGVGGLVSAVDAAAGTVTISVVSFSGKKETVIHTSKTTVIRRYALDSVKFDDAKPSTLQEVHPGDQLRARGDRNADGTQLTAEEIVSGSFRNIAGTVNSVDASAGTISVHDLLSKKNLVVKVTSDSQLRQLPPEMAQRIAARLKGGTTAGGATQGGATKGAAAGTPGAGAPGAAPSQGSGQATSGQSTPAPSSGTEGGSARGSGMGGRSGGGGDLQQMLSRMPASSLADLHKGDAVMLVSTEGANGSGIAIQLLSGVEPILQASPSAGQAMMLAPWSLGGPSGDTAGP